MNKKEIKGYENLSHEQRTLVETVLTNLENGTGLWTPGWEQGVPVSGKTGKAYHGMNNLLLTLISMNRGYTDDRWYTFHQISNNGWKFKGKSKGQGVSIEFFELRDKETKQPFDESVLDGMSEEERSEYMDENVYPLKKYSTVFNADLIDGVPEKKRVERQESEVYSRVDEFLRNWSEKEATIIYGGNAAFYRPSDDTIHLPEREKFLTEEDRANTSLHEVGHSTGSKTRLNRDLTGTMGSEKYAIEELRAEFASMFIAQQMGVKMTERHLNNNSAYISDWAEVIKKEPSILISAVADADKIMKYVLQKEKEFASGESTSRGEEQQTETPIKEEKSDVYIPPSEVAAKAVAFKREAIEGGGGIETLTRMSDRDVVERAMNGKGADKFSQLYNGFSLLGSEEKDERSLMTRIAMYCSGGEEQAVRVYKSSKQYKEDKPNAYYLRLAQQAMEFVAKIKNGQTERKPVWETGSQRRFGRNAKV